MSDKHKHLLPIGSVVRLNGSSYNRKILIINRIIPSTWKGKEGYFEYMGCKHIKGIDNNELLYFNSENIAQVCFEGYKNDDEETAFQLRYQHFLESNMLNKLYLEAEK